MESVAKLKNCPTSPRKMRLMADSIRGMDVYDALNVLRFAARKESARRLEKLVRSAVHNWEHKNEVDAQDHDLFIKQISVDSGRSLKRFRPAPQGRAHRIRKRSNHVNVVIDSRIPVMNQSAEEVEVEEVEEDND